MSGLQGDQYRAELVRREALAVLSRHQRHELWVECVRERRGGGMEVVIMGKPSPVSQQAARLMVLESGLAGSNSFCNRIAQELATKYGLKLTVPPDDDFGDC